MSELDRKTFLRLMTVGAASFLGRPLRSFAQNEANQPQFNPPTGGNAPFVVPNRSQDFSQAQLRQPVAQNANLLSGAPSNSQASWGRLKFRCVDGDWDDWNAHAHGDLNLLENLTKKTSVSVSSSEWNVASIEKLDEMVRFPFLFMHAEMTPDLAPEHIANLREYLLRGGFLFAEDCVRGKNHHRARGEPDFFFQGIMSAMPNVLPEAKIEKLPNDHPLYNCFYHLPNGLPFCQGQRHGGYGVTLNGRLVAFLSPHDIHCGWTNPRWFTGRDPMAGEYALQMGTNLYIYAMTQGA